MTFPLCFLFLLLQDQVVGTMKQFRTSVLSLSSITVVQSYFVHWAGIESPVVHDQSRGFVRWSNITSMDEWKLASLLQEEEVAPLPGANLQLWWINILKLKLAKV